MYIYVHTHIYAYTHIYKTLDVPQNSLCASSPFKREMCSLTDSCCDIFLHCRDSQQTVLTSTTLSICSALFWRKIRANKHVLNVNLVWALVCMKSLNSREFEALILPCADHDNSVGKVPHYQRSQSSSTVVQCSPWIEMTTNLLITGLCLLLAQTASVRRQIVNRSFHTN